MGEREHAPLTVSGVTTIEHVVEDLVNPGDITVLNPSVAIEPQVLEDLDEPLLCSVARLEGTPFTQRN